MDWTKKKKKKIQSVNSQRVFVSAFDGWNRIWTTFRIRSASAGRRTSGKKEDEGGET